MKLIIRTENKQSWQVMKELMRTVDEIENYKLKGFSPYYRVVGAKNKRRRERGQPMKGGAKPRGGDDPWRCGDLREFSATVTLDDGEQLDFAVRREGPDLITGRLVHVHSHEKLALKEAMAPVLGLYQLRSQDENLIKITSEGVCD